MWASSALRMVLSSWPSSVRAEPATSSVLSSADARHLLPNHEGPIPKKTVADRSEFLPTHPEQIPDHTVDREETLGMSCALEPPHLPLSMTDGVRCGGVELRIFEPEAGEEPAAVSETRRPT